MNTLREILGMGVHVWYLVKGNIIAYSWHEKREKSLNYLKKIMEYHGLDGKIIYAKYNDWLTKKLEEVVIEGKSFELPEINYRNRRVYEEIIRIPHGKTATYSEIAKRAKVRFNELLLTLMRNPLQVLIPCHRLLTKKGTLMGFYPLGKEVKMRLFERESVEDAK